MEADQIMEDVVSKEAIRIRDDLVARHKARGESVYSLSPRAMIPYSTHKYQAVDNLATSKLIVKVGSVRLKTAP